MEKSDLSHHILSRYNEELERVRTSVLQMGGFVDEQLKQAVLALVQGDSRLGEGRSCRHVPRGPLQLAPKQPRRQGETQVPPRQRAKMSL